MVHQIKKSIDEGKVYFGIKECLKNNKKIESAFLVSDHRKEIASLLKANGVSASVLDLNKQETKERLGLDFDCEVFGLRK